MRIEPEISGVSVVLLGDFNPAIFTPAWFALNDLLPRSAADNARLQVAHSQILDFSAEWLHLHITTDRFLAETQQGPYGRLRDLVVRVFKEHLYHTPLKAVGINRDVHFRVSSSADRDRIHGILAPLKPWSLWVHNLGLDEQNVGMTSLRMTALHPLGRPSGGLVNVTVEPSSQIDNGRTGIYVHVNDHFTISSPNATGREQLIESLESDFDSSIKRSDDIIDQIMSLATVREE